ncbi:MAG: autotransporter-associated beta strand repeat-containing protein, partial [Planctomycetes bacterium]|nr:autotransporter-associated beta strand repeat-containing protein [Planctomycetota bacterium]
FNTNGQSVTFSGVLVASNTAGLTKTGSGSLILTAENLYAGTTTISTGTLQVGNGGSTGSITTGIVTNAASLVFNRNDPITYAGAIGGTGSLTLQGASTLTLTGSSTYTGATAVQNGTIVLAGGNNRLATTGTVTLGGSTTVGNLILGNASGPTNQTLGLIAASGSGGRIVGGNAAFSMLTVNNATSGTFAGTIGGSDVNESNLNLTKSGVGMLTLTAANTLYSGTTTMNGGFLTLGSSTALGTSGPITFTGGGIGYTSASAGVDLASRFKNSTSAITISTNLQSPVTIAGTIDSTNSGGLMLSTGTLTLSGSNSYSGNTTVSDGANWTVTRLNIANANALGSGSLVFANTNSFDNTSGGPLTLNTNLILAAGSPYFAGSNNITFSGTGLFSGAASLAVISGTLTLGSLNTDIQSRTANFIGPGTLQLAGPAGPTFATSTTGISSGGRLLISHPNALGSTAFINMNGGSFESTVDLSGSNALPNYLYVGNVVAFTGSNNITFSGTVGHDAPNAGRAISSNLTNGATLTLAGPVLLQSNTTAIAARTLDIGGTGLTLISGPISNGVLSFSNGLSKSGWGTLTLTASNSFTGGFTLSNGNVIIGNKSALGSGTIALSGGTLQASSSMSGANAITNATISLTGAASMITGSSDITLTGSLVSTGGFTKAGSHTLTLTGSSTYSGATAVQDGTLVLAGGNNRVVSAGGLTFGTGTSFGRLVLGDGSGPSNNTFGLITTTGSGGTIVGGNAAVSILTANSISSGTFAGTIGGLGTNENSLAFTKSGAGTLTLTNANTYSGTTSISGGVLSLANASAIGPGAITFGGGTMQLTAANAIDYSSRIVSSTSAIAIDTNSQSLTFSSPLVSSNTAGLAKSGTGTLTLSVGNLYSGTTR